MVAIGILKFSRKGRQSLFILLIVLNVIQLSLGVTLVALSAQAKTSTSLVHSEEREDIQTLFTVIELFGINVVVNHLIGLKISIKCLKEPFRGHTNLLVCIWIWSGISTAIDGIICASLAFTTADKLVNEVKSSLARGMGQYLTDPTWRVLYDRLQQTMACCGVEGFTDWHQTAWIHMEYLMEDSETVLKYAEPDARVLPPVTPWSCCRPSYRMPCFHDPIQQSRFHHAWADPRMTLSSIYQEGCLGRLRVPIEGALQALVAVNIFVFLLQIAISVLTRFLYTSSRNAVALGSANGPAPGWLIGRGDFGIVGGTPLSSFATRKRKPDAVVDLALDPEIVRGAHNSSKSSIDRRSKETKKNVVATESSSTPSPRGKVKRKDKLKVKPKKATAGVSKNRTTSKRNGIVMESDDSSESRPHQKNKKVRKNGIKLQERSNNKTATDANSFLTSPSPKENHTKNEKRSKGNTQQNITTNGVRKKSKKIIETDLSSMSSRTPNPKASRSIKDGKNVSAVKRPAKKRQKFKSRSAQSETSTDNSLKPMLKKK